MRIFLRFAPILFVSVVLPFSLGAPRPAAAQVDVGVSITVPPPPLPVYAQPVIPEPGYIWIPGYWAWGPYGYYWVPGTWILPPAVGLLWTPGYWAWSGGVYFWHAGYWGPRVGFYGGIVYGFGYDGIGYHGGFWDHDRFHYNAAANNLAGAHITNVYRRTVVNNVNVTRVSFNGGHGGTALRPTAAQQAFANEHHVGETDMQRRHDEAARGQRDLQSSVNHGRPPIAATPRATSFTGHGITGAGPARPAPHAAPPRNTRQHVAPSRNAAPRVVHPANGPAPHGFAPGGPVHPEAQHGGPPHGPQPQHEAGPRGGEPHGGGPHGGPPQGHERDRNDH